MPTTFWCSQNKVCFVQDIPSSVDRSVRYATLTPRNGGAGSGGAYGTPTRPPMPNRATPNTPRSAGGVPELFRTPQHKNWHLSPNNVSLVAMLKVILHPDLALCNFWPPLKPISASYVCMLACLQDTLFFSC